MSLSLTTSFVWARRGRGEEDVVDGRRGGRAYWVSACRPPWRQPELARSPMVVRRRGPAPDSPRRQHVTASDGQRSSAVLRGRGLLSPDRPAGPGQARSVSLGQLVEGAVDERPDTVRVGTLGRQRRPGSPDRRQLRNYLGIAAVEGGGVLLQEECAVHPGTGPLPGASMDEELSDGEVPEVPEQRHGLVGGAPAAACAVEDGLDEPQGLVAQPTDEPVDREHLDRPRQVAQCVMEGDRGRAHSRAGLRRQVRTRQSGRVVTDQPDQQVLTVTHVVVDGCRADAELPGQATDGEVLPSLRLDEAPGRGEYLLLRCRRGAPSPPRPLRVGPFRHAHPL